MHAKPGALPLPLHGRAAHTHAERPALRRGFLCISALPASCARARALASRFCTSVLASTCASNSILHSEILRAEVGRMLPRMASSVVSTSIMGLRAGGLCRRRRAWGVWTRT